MNRIRRFYAIIAAMVVLLGEAQCQRKQDHDTELTPDAFQSKLNELPDAQLIDVRTPGEFAKNHIKNALNLDIRGSEFSNQVAALDKDKPVLVYCLSGGRSEKAAEYMREQGFKNVYELSGGMMQWTAQNKPYEAGSVKSTGMTVEQFNELLNTDQLVLVDFSAKWCAPCKKMAPWLEELSTQYDGKLKLLKIDADENETLVRNFQINALPTLLLYKAGKQVWTNIGLIDKSSIEQHIKTSL